MRIIGSLNRSEIETDPCKAWRRARLLDAWLRAASPARPHGVTRATHDAMMQQDESRMLEAARRINRR